jgi:sigma-E factor negative regulatory protein RseC
MSNKISHPGVVDGIEGDCVKVRIVQTSACAACKVAAHCNASESKEKLVDVFGCDTAKYATGQEVVVSASREVANRAILLGFGLPLLLLIGVLLMVLRWTGDEGMAAMASLGALVPYYIVLWLLRDSIGQRVSFQIDK